MRGETSDSWTEVGRKIVHEIGVAARGPVVATGFPHEQAEEERTEGGATNAEIAIFNEFGTETSPPRPFMEIAYTTNRVKMRGMINGLLVQIGEGKLTVAEALKRVGVAHVGQIKEVIGTNVPPPNDPDTILRKLKKAGFKVVPGATDGGKDAAGSVTTLIDTGQMRQSTGFEVRMGGKGE